MSRNLNETTERRCDIHISAGTAPPPVPNFSSGRGHASCQRGPCPAWLTALSRPSDSPHRHPLRRPWLPVDDLCLQINRQADTAFLPKPMQMHPCPEPGMPWYLGRRLLHLALDGGRGDCGLSRNLSSRAHVGEMREVVSRTFPSSLDCEHNRMPGVGGNPERD